MKNKIKNLKFINKIFITTFFLIILYFININITMKATETTNNKYHIFVTNDIYTKDKPFTLDKKLADDAIHVALINNSINTASLASITWSSTDETVLKVALGGSVSGIQSYVKLEAAYPGTAQLRVTVEEYTGGLDVNGNPAKIQYYAEATVIVPFRLDYVPVYNPDKKTGFSDVAAGYGGATIPTTEKNTNVLIVEDKTTYDTVVLPIAIKLKNDIMTNKHNIGWTSSNDSVANVKYTENDNNTVISILGAGATYITGTLLKDTTQTATIPVLVRPNLNSYKYLNGIKTNETGWTKNGYIEGDLVYIETNTEKASNLTWRVHEIINGKEQKQECIEGIDYEIIVNNTNNITIFKLLRQGTFRVYANAELGEFMDLSKWANYAKSHVDVFNNSTTSTELINLNINYDDCSITIISDKAKRVYYSFDGKNPYLKETKKRYCIAEVENIHYNGRVVSGAVIDISKTSSIKNSYISIKYDITSTSSAVYKLPKRLSTNQIKNNFKYEPKQHAISMPDNIQIEYRKASTSKWITLTDSNTTIIGNKRYLDVTRQEVKGAKLYFRYSAINGSTTNTSTSNINEFSNASRASNIVNININPRRIAPRISINGSKLILSGVKNCEWRLSTDTNWQPIITTSKIALNDLTKYAKEFIVNNSIIKQSVLEFRYAETPTKSYSNIRSIIIPKQALAPINVYCEVDNFGNLKWINSNNTMEYCVLNSNVINYSTQKWLPLKDLSSKYNKNLKNSSVIIAIRYKVNKKDTKYSILASSPVFLTGTKNSNGSITFK